MSPEQARGQAVDDRTDVFAFGCVLYEMLTGERAFRGETVSDIVASVLKSEPDWDALPASLPSKLRDLLRRCLAKSRVERMRDIGDVGLEIAEVLSAGAEAPLALASPAIRARERALWAGGLVACAVLALWLSFLRSGPPTGATRLTVVSSPEFDWVAGGLAISPDGRHVVYASTADAGWRLTLRAMDSFEGRSLPGTEGAVAPFFSPDSRSLGFFAHRELRTVTLDGSA